MTMGQFLLRNVERGMRVLDVESAPESFQPDVVEAVKRWRAADMSTPESYTAAANELDSVLFK